jgi:hypothetical protein
MLSKGILQTTIKLYNTSGSHYGIERNSSLSDYDAVYIGI